MTKFDYHILGGTMVFYNSDQSISGEVRRSSISDVLLVIVENGKISKEETEKLTNEYFKTLASKR